MGKRGTATQYGHFLSLHTGHDINGLPAPSARKKANTFASPARLPEGLATAHIFSYREKVHSCILHPQPVLLAKCKRAETKY